MNVSSGILFCNPRKSSIELSEIYDTFDTTRNRQVSKVFDFIGSFLQSTRYPFSINLFLHTFSRSFHSLWRFPATYSSYQFASYCNNSKLTNQCVAPHEHRITTFPAFTSLQLHELFSSSLYIPPVVTSITSRHPSDTNSRLTGAFPAIAKLTWSCAKSIYTTAINVSCERMMGMKVKRSDPKDEWELFLTCSIRFHSVFLFEFEKNILGSRKFVKVEHSMFPCTVSDHCPNK
jgi:hypothetical protein